MTKKFSVHSLLFAVFLLGVLPATAQIKLIANSSLTSSPAGLNKDLSGLDYTLENGVPADLLGGLGSGLTYLSGNTFLAIPDRGPNAVSFNPLIDDTSSFVARFHAIDMHLQPNQGPGLPFTISPELQSTTLLYSASTLVYGSGNGLNIGSGVPPINRPSRNYFTGRSDNFDPNQSSQDPSDARLDPESIRVSNDGVFVYISDEYGPYVYQFLRVSGQRVRTFRLPDEFFVAHPAPTGSGEVAANLSGRTPNKGMEGIAITPDGRTIVGMLQAATIQDNILGSPAASLLRFVTIDAQTGKTTHQFAYLLTTGSGVSDITAINDHEFLVDERDGKGLGDGSKAKVKQIFKIDISNAVDISGLDGTHAAVLAVPKTLFLDVVKVLNDNGITSDKIPAKLEGLSFGPDIQFDGQTVHTLWLANDNDFLQDFSGPGTNPSQFFVFGVSDADLGGSVYAPQDHSYMNGGI